MNRVKDSNAAVTAIQEFIQDECSYTHREMKPYRFRHQFLRLYYIPQPSDRPLSNSDLASVIVKLSCREDHECQRRCQCHEHEVNIPYSLNFSRVKIFAAELDFLILG